MKSAASKTATWKPRTVSSIAIASAIRAILEKGSTRTSGPLLTPAESGGDTVDYTDEKVSILERYMWGTHVFTIKIRVGTEWVRVFEYTGTISTGEWKTLRLRPGHWIDYVMDLPTSIERMRNTPIDDTKTFSADAPPRKRTSDRSRTAKTTNRKSPTSKSKKHHG